MAILKDRTCPKCKAEHALVICAWTGAVNCSECTETIRFLTKEERKEFLENLGRLEEETGQKAMTYLREE